MKKRIALLFGTFNPIHNGHLLISTMLLNNPNFDGVVFVPSGEIQKNGEDILPLNQRASMIMMAFFGDSAKLFSIAANQELEGQIYKNKTVGISYVEERIERGSRYTYDIIEQLEQENPHIEYSIVIGGDQANNFKNWYRYGDLIAKYKVYVVLRDGEKLPLEDFDTTYITMDKIGVLGKLNILGDCPRIDISSRRIRDMIKEGKCVNFYLPQPVIETIKKNGHYE